MHPHVTTIHGGTELLFVVADPVAQVKAPEAVNWLLARAGIAAVAVPAQIKAERLQAFVHESLAIGNARGLFVSIPHKTALVEIVDRLDEQAQMAGAVNAVRHGPDGRLEGALFDGQGLMAALHHHRIALAGSRVLLLGAGGAGLAIAAALIGAPLASLRVFDPDSRRVSMLVDRLAPHAGFSVQGMPTNDPSACELVIHATPLGLRSGDPLPLDADRLMANASVVDILMTGEASPLVQAARRRGVRAFMGHEMLVQQLPAYLEYFGYTDLARSLRAEHAHWLEDVRALLGGSPAVF